MKKFAIYFLLLGAVLTVIYYFTDLPQIFALLLAPFGVILKKNPAADLDTKAEKLKEEIKELDESKPVKDLTPEEEKDYWKEQ